MKISEFIEYLECVKAIQGDIEVAGYTKGHDSEPLWDFPNTSQIMEATRFNTLGFPHLKPGSTVLFLGDPW